MWGLIFNRYKDPHGRLRCSIFGRDLAGELHPGKVGARDLKVEMISGHGYAMMQNTPNEMSKWAASRLFFSLILHEEVGLLCSPRVSSNQEEKLHYSLQGNSSKRSKEEIIPRKKWCSHTIIIRFNFCVCVLNNCIILNLLFCFWYRGWTSTASPRVALHAWLRRGEFISKTSACLKFEEAHNPS